MIKIIAFLFTFLAIMGALIGGWAGAVALVTAAAIFALALLLRRTSKVIVPELTVATVYTRHSERFSRFLETGTHWINPITEVLGADISTAGQTASGVCSGVQAIGGLSLSFQWTLNYTLEPTRLAAAQRPKLARALPTKADIIAQRHINNVLHHIIGDYTLEQLCEPGVHRKLERQVRQLAKARLEPLGFAINRIMIDAIHMPKQVLAALEAAHEQKMQAEQEARALAHLQQVISQFSEKDMQRLMELERIHALGRNGVAMFYPALNDIANGRASHQKSVPLSPSHLTPALS